LREADNDYMQLLVEGGALLCLPVAFSIGAFVVLVRRRFREESSVGRYWLRAGAATGLAAIALQETVSCSLQVPGNSAMFAVLCAIAVHRGRERHGGQHPGSAPVVHPPPAVARGPFTHSCRLCGSVALHRSRTRSNWENWRRDLTDRRPYRCQRCGWRGWLVDVGSMAAARVEPLRLQTAHPGHRPGGCV
jgi:hypothetical protein